MTVRSLIVAAYIIKKEGWFNLKIAGRIDGYENDLRIGVLKDHPILRDILDKGVNSITPIEREEIINRHTGLVVQEGIDQRIVWRSIGTLSGLIALIVLWNTMLHRKVRSEVAKNLEVKERLYQKMKEAEIGALIANISHQWREPLSRLSSINLLTLMKLKMKQSIDEEWLLKKSQEIENTIDFMSQTMQNFLEFYKKSDKQTTFSIRESIEQTLFIIETKLLDESVEVEIDGEYSFMTNGIKNEWMQVWLNIITNAIQIFHQRSIANPKITITIEPSKITIVDNGGGIKNSDKSNGLGLLMCSEIIGKYGGTFQFDNRNEGLCITIHLRSVCDNGVA